MTDIIVQLPDGPVDHVVDMARKMVEVGALYQLGKLRPPAPIAGLTNQCEDEGCLYLGFTEDSQGKKWHLYQCGDVLKAYPA